MLLLRRRVSTFSASLWLDGLVAATAAGALGASVLVEVVVNSTHGSPLVVVTNMAYPIGDVLLLALIVFVFSVTRWRPGSRLDADRRRPAPQRGRRRRLPLPDGGRDATSRARILDLAWPLSLVLVALAAWQRPGRVARVELQARALLGTPIVCGLIGDRSARRRVAIWPVHAARARARQRDDRARPRADGAQLPGERRGCSRPAAARR